ncbi:MAG: hypothetical protein LBH31_00125 [Burkholderiaceae bacterium]|jgi:hypothetical protein|nr:hypothetical protein [Burkholderiaceae bacterium]
MDIATVKHVLLWCTIIDYVILLVWFGALMVARDPLYRLHTRWFRLERVQFDALHYGGMAVFKIGILLFNLVPLIALCIAG